MNCNFSKALIAGAMLLLFSCSKKDSTENPDEPPADKLEYSSQIAVGWENSIVIRKDKSMWMAGTNYYYQIGDQNTAIRKAHVKIADNVLSASVSSGHTLFVKANNELWGMGFNGFGELGNGTYANTISTPFKIMDSVVKAVASDNYSVILKMDGTVWVTGDGTYGKLGDGKLSGKRNIPLKVMDNVKDIAGKYQTTLFLKKDKSLWGCGENEDGKLGDGTSVNRSTPIKIMDDVASMDAGQQHSLFVKTNGQLWGSGSNSNGMLGKAPLEHNERVFTPILMMEGVKKAVAGFEHTLIIKTDNSLWGVGGNTGGQLGDGTGTTIYTPKLVINNVLEVVTFHSNSLIVTTAGVFMASGSNYNGELGVGKDGNLLAFTNVLLP